MAGSFTGVQTAVERLGTRCAATALVEFTTHSVSDLGSAVAADGRHDDLARWAGTAVAQFPTGVRTLATSVTATTLSTRVRLGVGVGLGVLLLEAEAVVGRHRLLGGCLAVRAGPAVDFVAIGRLGIVVLDVVLLADPIFEALQVASDAATLATPHCARRRALEQADDAFSPLIDLLL